MRRYVSFMCRFLGELFHDSANKKRAAMQHALMPFIPLNSADVRRLYRRQRGLDAAPVGSCFTVALGFACRGPLSGFEHGSFAAHFLKLTSIVQDFESLHHR